MVEILPVQLACFDLAPSAAWAKEIKSHQLRLDVKLFFGVLFWNRTNLQFKQQNQQKKTACVTVTRLAHRFSFRNNYLPSAESGSLQLLINLATNLSVNWSVVALDGVFRFSCFVITGISHSWQLLLGSFPFLARYILSKFFSIWDIANRAYDYSTKFVRYLYSWFCLVICSLPRITVFELR